MNRASLWAEMLDYVTDGAAAAEIIDRDHLSPYFRLAEKLYESLGNQTRASTIEAYRQGRHLVNHVGHAWYTSLNVGPGFTSEHEIRAGDFDTIPTGGRWGIIYSIGCMPGAMERSCLAEHYVNSPEGGGVAFIGNCSYGWSLPYFSGYASSDLYDQQFFGKLLVENSPSLGSAHAAAKAQFIGAAQSENEYRWVMYDLNLFGDPTLAVWTGGPESLDVVCPDSLLQGASDLPITVFSRGVPLPQATACLYGGSVYERETTDGVGQAILKPYNLAEDTLLLSVTARNHFPFIKKIPVVENSSKIYISEARAEEILGNADSLPGPGELISLSLTLENDGNLELGDSLHFHLASADSLSQLVDSSFTAPAPPFGSMIIGPFLSFWADSSTGDGTILKFTLEVSDSSGDTWCFPVQIMLSAPSPALIGYRVDDRSGNGNGVPEPGEAATLYIQLTNLGRATLDGAAISLATSDSGVAMIDSTASPPAIRPDSTYACAFQIYVNPGMPGPWRAPVFKLRCRYGWKEWRDSLAVAMDQVGLADDMESGAPGWQAGGGWHLSAIRSHSPVHSWYFGSELDTLMPQYRVDTLQTPAFMAGPACSLSWWQRHEFVPGWSWGVVEICGDFGARLLEVVEGSSGGWRNRIQDLSRYQPGTVLSLRFIAVCDSVRSEGWYIDDVNVKSLPSGASVWPPAVIPSSFQLNPCHPNPCQGWTKIGFSLPQADQTSLKIYNVQGQLVRTLVEGGMTAGFHSAVWDGRDYRGRKVAGGMYLYRLSTGTAAETRKMLVIK